MRIPSPFILVLIVVCSIASAVSVSLLLFCAFSRVNGRLAPSSSLSNSAATVRNMFIDIEHINATETAQYTHINSIQGRVSEHGTRHTRGIHNTSSITHCPQHPRIGHVFRCALYSSQHPCVVLSASVIVRARATASSACPHAKQLIQRTVTQYITHDDVTPAHYNITLHGHNMRTTATIQVQAQQAKVTTMRASSTRRWEQPVHVGGM